MIYWLVSRHNLKYLAWGLLPLALLVAVLLLFFRAAEQNPPLPDVIDQASGYMLLQLEGANHATGDLTEAFVPLAVSRRDQLLNRLASFRADYRPSSPQLRVWARPGLESRRQLARDLGHSLAQQDLGRRIRDLSGPRPGTIAPVVLVCSRRDSGIARELLATLSLQLAGPVELRFDDSVDLESMTLLLLGDPTFTPEGVAIFARDA